MSRAILVLHQEHKSMFKLLGLMRSLVDEMDDGKRPDVLLLNDIGDYLTGYPELCHHPKEDLIFRKLQSRNPDAVNSGTNLLDEHERLTGLIESFVKSMEIIGKDPEFDMAPFISTMRELVDAYSHHMEMEEKHFFPMSLEELTADDWAEVYYAVSEQEDPLLDEATTKYSRLRDEIFRSARRHDELGQATPQEKFPVLGAINSLEQFNALMESRGLSVELKKASNATYELTDKGVPVVEFPGCGEERACWCASCYVLGRYSTSVI